MKTVLAASLAALLAAPSLAHAQATFKALQPEGVPTVFVTDRTGHETKGKLLQITDSVLTIQLEGGTSRTFTPDDVSLVERQGDSLQNGALAGMGVGIGLGILSAGLADCPGARNGCPGFRVFGVILSTALYAAIGTGIDAAIPGRTRIWPAKQRNGGLVATASPADRRLFVGWRISRR